MRESCILAASIDTSLSQFEKLCRSPLHCQPRQESKIGWDRIPLASETKKGKVEMLKIHVLQASLSWVECFSTKLCENYCEADGKSQRGGGGIFKIVQAYFGTFV